MSQKKKQTNASKKKNKGEKNKGKRKLDDSLDSSNEIPDKLGKLFKCFVSGCTEETEWTSSGSLLNHINLHLSGSLRGTVSSFFSAWRLTTCSICKHQDHYFVWYDAQAPATDDPTSQYKVMRAPKVIPKFMLEY